MEKDCFTSWGRDPDRWRTAQRDDPTLRQIGGHLEQGELPAAVQRLSLTQPVKRLWNQWRRLALFEGVVCRKVYDSSTLETLKQVLFPKSKIQALLDTCHKQAAHPGTEQMLSLLRRNFYWPQMEQVVQHYAQNCPRCTLHKARANIRAPLVPLTTKAPMQIVAMDFLTLSRPTERYAKIESKLVKGLCQVYGCHKTHTTPYHPQGNGACERFIQMLLSLLGTLEVEQHSNWVGYLPGLIQSYINTIHSSTSYAPSFLMFGHHFRTPIDLITGAAGPDNTATTTEWVERHQTQLHYAYNKVTAHLHKAAWKNTPVTNVSGV